MATVPAFLVGTASLVTFRQMRSWLVGHHTSEETYASLRCLLLDLERALARQPHATSSNSSNSSNSNINSKYSRSGSQWGAARSHRGEGLLLTLVWRLRRLATTVQRAGRVSRRDALAFHAGRLFTSRRPRPSYFFMFTSILGPSPRLHSLPLFLRHSLGQIWTSWPTAASTLPRASPPPPAWRPATASCASPCPTTATAHTPPPT
jgi:hypothetical protein